MRSATLLLALSACATESQLTTLDVAPPQAQESCLSVSPDSVDFGTVVVGVDPPPEATLTLRSDCPGDLQLDSPYLTDEHAPFELGPVDALALLSGQEVELIVRFEPRGEYRGATQIVLETDAGAQAIHLEAEALAPVLEVDLETEVGFVATGCPTEEELTIRNSGSAPVDIHALTLDSPSGAFSLAGMEEGEDPTESALLAPGEALVQRLRLQTGAPGEERAWLHLDSTDPHLPERTIPIRAISTEEGSFSEEYQLPYRPQVDVVWVVDRSS